MTHDDDPRQRIMDQVGPYLPDITVMGANVLCISYVRPEKTKGGILLADDSRDEDRYQGKAQLVVKLGPQAFEETDQYSFPIMPEVGDWIMIRVGDSLPFLLGKLPARLVIDTNVRMIIARPDIVL